MNKSGLKIRHCHKMTEVEPEEKDINRKFHIFNKNYKSVQFWLWVVSWSRVLRYCHAVL